MAEARATRSRWMSGKVRGWVAATHRDLGYFSAALVVAYALSGIALNHVDDWNPDFEITKQTIRIPRSYTQEELTPEVLSGLGNLVGEAGYKLFDVPHPGQVKLYFDNASLHIRLEDKTGLYERISRRPLFFQVNVLHHNSLKGWKWASDIFAFILLIIAGTGVFVLRGRNGLGGRGKWFLLAGLLPPLLALVIFELK